MVRITTDRDNADYFDGTGNARFWVYWNETWCKITLRPGETLELSEAHNHDEGWRSTVETYEHDGERVNYSIDTDGTDCDGRLSASRNGYCELGQLMDVLPNEYLIEDGNADVMRPNWQEGSASQRDYAAEASGY